MDVDKTLAKKLDNATTVPEALSTPVSARCLPFRISGSSPEKKFDALLPTRAAKIMETQTGCVYSISDSGKVEGASY